MALELETNANAQVLRSATTDRLYWLRQELEGASAPLPLLDRLVAAEPTWVNYDRRARVHMGLNQWYEAVRDELEAVRLTGDRYWRIHSSPVGGDWLIDRIAQAPDRPREQYELALRWAEANKGARVGSPGIPGFAAPQLANRPLMIGLSQFRLGRYADSLATLRQSDVPKVSHAAGMLMSPWNRLTITWGNSSVPGVSLVPGMPDGNPPPWRWTPTQFTFDPMDLAVRAMCYHHLGQPKEAAACLRHTRELLSKERASDEQRALLHEAETLIEGKARP